MSLRGYLAPTMDHSYKAEKTEKIRGERAAGLVVEGIRKRKA